MNINPSDPAKKVTNEKAQRFLRRFDYETRLTNTGAANPKKPIPFFDFRKDTK